MRRATEPMPGPGLRPIQRRWCFLSSRTRSRGSMSSDWWERSSELQRPAARQGGRTPVRSLLHQRGNAVSSSGIPCDRLGLEDLDIEIDAGVLELLEEARA